MSNLTNTLSHNISELVNSFHLGGILKQPGDTFTAMITRTGRLVMKQITNEVKQSVTIYPTTGTQVFTRSIK